MMTDGFLTDSLFTIVRANKGNELDRYCRLEGMDYQHLVSEVHNIKSMIGRKKYTKLDSIHSNRTN